MQISLHTVQCT